MTLSKARVRQKTRARSMSNDACASCFFRSFALFCYRYHNSATRSRVIAARHLLRTFSRFADACVCETLFPAVHKMDVSRRLSDIPRAALIIAFRVGVPHFIHHRFQRPALAMGLRELASVFFTPISELKKEYTFRALVRSSPAARVLRPCHFPRRKYSGAVYKLYSATDAANSRAPVSRDLHVQIVKVQCAASALLLE